MKTLTNLSILENNRLNSYELRTIRGGANKGGSMPIGEDILLPDPEPGEPGDQT